MDNIFGKRLNELRLERKEHVLTQCERYCHAGSLIHLLALPAPADLPRLLGLTFAFALVEVLPLLPLEKAGPSQFNPLI